MAFEDTAIYNFFCEIAKLRDWFSMVYQSKSLILGIPIHEFTCLCITTTILLNKLGKQGNVIYVAFMVFVDMQNMQNQKCLTIKVHLKKKSVYLCVHCCRIL